MRLQELGVRVRRCVWQMVEEQINIRKKPERKQQKGVINCSNIPAPAELAHARRALKG
jgi:hypothetical protein